MPTGDGSGLELTLADEMFFQKCKIDKCKCKGCINNRLVDCLVNNGNCYANTFLELCPIKRCKSFSKEAGVPLL